MKPFSTLKLKLILIIAPMTLVLSFIMFSSFVANRFTDDFLKQLGITKPAADEKISNSIIGGSLDIYGVKNARNIAIGNRKTVALNLLAYVKKHVNSPAFIKQYTELKTRNKPQEKIADTPEQMKEKEIQQAKKGIADIETSIKKADANSKPIFEKVLEEAQKNLKRIEDPANKNHVAYAKNYEKLVASNKEKYNRQLADWERRYPANHMWYIKTRLLEFMEATKDVDFEAELTTKNGKKHFVNPAYERKSSRWKMAFRAGREVVEPSREFVQKWIEEIK